MKRLFDKLMRWCDSNEDAHTGNLGERRKEDRRRQEDRRQEDRRHGG